VRSTNVLKFIETQNTWCYPFAYLAWNDPAILLGATLIVQIQLVPENL